MADAEPVADAVEAEAPVEESEPAVDDEEVDLDEVQPLIDAAPEPAAAEPKPAAAEAPAEAAGGAASSEKVRRMFYAAIETGCADRSAAQLGAIASYLSDDNFLKGLDREHMMDCCKHLELRRLEGGVDIMTQGDQGEEFYILLEGDCELIINGNYIKDMSARTSFGEIALTGETPESRKRSATIRAKTTCVLAFLHLEAFREITASREETTDERAVHPVIDWTPLKTGDLKAIEIADTHGWFSRPKYVIVTPDEEIDTSPTAEEAKKHKSMLDIKSAKEFKSEMKDLKQGMKGSKDVRKEVLIFDRADAELDERGWATKMTIEDDHMKKQEPTMYELWQTSEAEIGSFGGPGMRLYFFIVRSLAKLFLAMAIISIPTIVTFLSGEVYDESPLAPFGATLAMFTMGNIDDPTTEIESGKGSKLWWVSCMSVISSFGLLSFIMKMGHNMRVIIKEADHNAISMSDYTVKIMPKQDSWAFLMGVPFAPHQYKKAQLAHGKPYTKGTPGWTEYDSKKEEASHLGGERKKALELDVKTSIEQTLAAEIEKELGLNANTHDHEKVDVVAHIGTDAVGNPRPAIWSAWNERENITAWTQKFQLFYQLEEGLALACGPGGTTAKLDTTLTKLENLNQHLLNWTQKPWRPVTTFVSFETPFHRDLALKRKEIVVDNTVCSIDEAPEPESIQYQNLQTSYSEIRFRTIGMNLLTLTLIFFAAIGIVQVQIAVGAMAYLEDCGEIWGPDSDETTTLPSTVCPAHSLADIAALKANYEARMEREIDGDNIYIFSDDKYLISMNTTYHPDDPAQLIGAACYSCICNTIKKEWNNFTANDYLGEDARGDFCEPFKSDKMKEAAKDMLATITIVGMNQFLKQFIVRTTGWLRAHTKEAEMQSKATRVYMAQVMNTAVLAALINSNLPVFADIRTAEHFDHSNFEWFAKVGAPMTKTMAVQFTVPWIAHFAFSQIFKFQAWLGNRMAVTQNRLNQSREPLSWDIAAGYGEVLMAMTVTLLYGPGVPLLYWGAAFGFTVRYWMDKWACLRVYKRPPLYGHEVMTSFDKILALVAVVHCMVATYFITVAGVKGDVRTHVENSEMLHPRFSASSFPPMFMVFLALLVCLWKYVDAVHDLAKAARKAICSKSDELDAIDIDMTIFEDLSLRVQTEIRSKMTERSCAKDEIVMRKGDPADEIYFVKKGVVETLLTDPAGPEAPRASALVEKGDCFGDEVVFATVAERMKYARCRTPVELLVLKKQDLLILFKEFETSKNLEKIVKHKIDGRYHCPPFSSAFKEGRIVNEDDNYLLDEYERLDELRAKFLEALDAKRGEAPFDKEGGEELYTRVKAAIEIPLVDLDNVQAGDGKAGGSQGSWKDGAQGCNGLGHCAVCCPCL